MADERTSDSAADRIVDELLPSEFAWREMVCSHPIPSLLVATAGGYLIGRKHGHEVVTAVTAWAEREVTRNINSLLGSRLGDPGG
jgi:hypothetical protein